MKVNEILHVLALNCQKVEQNQSISAFSTNTKWKLIN